MAEALETMQILPIEAPAMAEPGLGLIDQVQLGIYNASLAVENAANNVIDSVHRGFEKYSPILKKVGVKVGALALVSSVSLSACTFKDEPKLVGAKRVKISRTTTSTSTTTSSLLEQADNSLPGTIKDGSDAAIASDVDLGLTKCGGLGGKELWTEKPFTPDHLFGYYHENPKMVEATLNFWTDVMGSDALNFITENAATNADANQGLAVEGNDAMTKFLDKQIANTDIPEGTVIRNHYCPDKDGDGHPDAIKFLDLRVAHHGDKSLEGAKRTTTSGFVLTQENFQIFAQKMRDANKNPDLLIHYSVNFDKNGDGQIQLDEKFVYTVIDSAICGNAALKGEAPTPETTTTVPPKIKRPTATTTPPHVTTTVKPTTTTVHPKDPTTNYISPTNTSPNSGTLSPGTAGPEGTTSTTAKPVPPQSAPTTSTTMAGGNNGTTTSTAGTQNFNK